MKKVASQNSVICEGISKHTESAAKPPLPLATILLLLLPSHAYAMKAALSDEVLFAIDVFLLSLDLLICGFIFWMHYRTESKSHAFTIMAFSIVTLLILIFGIASPSYVWISLLGGVMLPHAWIAFFLLVIVCLISVYCLMGKEMYLIANSTVFMIFLSVWAYNSFRRLTMVEDMFGDMDTGYFVFQKVGTYVLLTLAIATILAILLTCVLRKNVQKKHLEQGIAASVCVYGYFVPMTLISYSNCFECGLIEDVEYLLARLLW